MPRTPPPAATNSVRPRLRVHHGADIALGPGKVDLLDAIDQAGTLAGAAERLGMSYMRAWKLVRTMNACFRRPLVEASRGGSRHGRAALTAEGRAVRDLYRQMEGACQDAIAPTWEALADYLLE